MSVRANTWATAAACCALAVAGLPLAAGTARADGHTLQNSRLAFLFGSSINGLTTADADRVDALTWTDTAGTPVSNYIAQATPECGDVVEFFGEAYGNGEDSRPYAVVRGVTSVWSGTTTLAGKAAITSPTACSTPLDATTTTSYALSTKPGLVNTLKITRSLTFVASPSGGDMRFYVVRIPLATYPDVVYPDSSNAVQTVAANGCGFNCVVTDWNGKWMADDTGAGQGIAIFRKANPGSPAEITIDWDADSSSNASAITLIQPSAGWSGKVTETEWLCFYDAASWTTAQRAAGTPPKGCTGIPH